MARPSSRTTSPRSTAAAPPVAGAPPGPAAPLVKPEGSRVAHPGQLVLYADRLFAEHLTPEWHPERPEREEAVVAGLAGSGAVARSERAKDGEVDDLLRVHDRDYVATVRELAAGGGGSLDPDTYVSPRSYAVALAGSGTTVAATDAALAAGPDDPARRAFAAVRPPGHHARPGRGMGFCLFNHVAVAAARARAVGGLERVAIVDFDVHHGNGTQEAFWDEPGVLYASIHRKGTYPGTGAADETGGDRARGATLNLPLVGSRTRPADYKAAFERLCDALVAYRPELIIASAGFDAYRDDPVGGLGLSEEHFRWIGARLRAVADASAGGRLVAALEGGYALEALGGLARAFAEGVTAEGE